MNVMHNFAVFLCISYCCVGLVELCQPQTAVYFPSNGLRAVAIMKGTLNGNKVVGVVRFEQSSLLGNMTVSVNISGLVAGQGAFKHGLHVHAFGISSVADDPTSQCGSTGGHFNPQNKTHGDISATVRHVGDYGNVLSDNNGEIVVAFNDSLSTLIGPFSVIGRAIVLHQMPDDLGLTEHKDSKTTGNSGSRVACGVIGIGI